MILGKFFTSGTPLELSYETLFRHVYIIGETGVGKSALLENVAVELLRDSFHIILLDPNGDLARRVAGHCHQDDTIYWEPFDEAYYLGWNPLQVRDSASEQERQLVCERLVAAMSHAWGLGQHTPRLLHILRYSLRLLIDSGLSVTELQELLSNRSYATSLLNRSLSQTVTAVWKDEFLTKPAKDWAEWVAPIQNRIGQFMLSPTFRKTLGSRSTINLYEVINGMKPKNLILNLSKGQYGEETSALHGSLIVSTVMSAVMARDKVPEEERLPLALIVDEFQDFLSGAFIPILAQGRKYRLSLVIAHQFLGQLESEVLRKAVLGTTGTKVAFRVGGEDVDTIAKALGIKQPDWPLDLPNRHALVRTLMDGQPTHAQELKTDETEAPQAFEAVRNHTRSCYGLTP